MKPLLNEHILLERFDAKGGWTFARVPQFDKTDKAWRGKLSGTIDGVEVKKCSLMSMGNGQWFFAIKADIRKQIKKEAGDKVHIILYPDNEPIIVPDEMQMCLEDEPRALAFFNTLSESERKYYIEWVYSAKQLETKVRRLTQTIDRLAQGLKRYDWEL